MIIGPNEKVAGLKAHQQCRQLLNVSRCKIKEGKSSLQFTNSSLHIYFAIYCIYPGRNDIAIHVNIETAAVYLVPVLTDVEIGVRKVRLLSKLGIFKLIY